MTQFNVDLQYNGENDTASKLKRPPKYFRCFLAAIFIIKLLDQPISIRDGTGQDFLDPTGKIENVRRLSGPVDRCFS